MRRFVGWALRMHEVHLRGVTHLFCFRGDRQWWVTPCELRFAQSQG